MPLTDLSSCSNPLHDGLFDHLVGARKQRLTRLPKIPCRANDGR
jgi:hypothetical protein